MKNKPKKSKSKKILLYIVGFILLVVIGAAVTVPGENAHKDALKKEFKNRVEETDFIKSLRGSPDYGTAMKSLMESTEELVDKNIEFEKKIFYSYGKSKLKNEEIRFSFGIFGHIYILDGVGKIVTEVEQGNK